MADLNGTHDIDRQKLHHARTRYDAALRDYMNALTAFNTVFNDPFNSPKITKRPRGKIANDPELRDFIEARLGKLMLREIVTDVAANFPPDRHTSISAVQRWDAQMRRPW